MNIDVNTIFNTDNTIDMDGCTGITTGFKCLDKSLYGGFQNGDLTILASRTSVGKTALALNFALNAATSIASKGSVGFFSLDAMKKQLITRCISILSGISLDSLRVNRLNQREHQLFSEANKRLSTLPIIFDCVNRIAVEDLCDRITQMKTQHDVKIVFIDYLQLLELKTNLSQRFIIVGQIVKMLKSLALSLEIPIVLLAQVSREVDKREDKIPRLSDLSDSASLEQDADIVMFLYREEYYLRNIQPKGCELREEYEYSDKYYKSKNNITNVYQEKHDQWKSAMEEVAGKAKLYIAKHRNGPLGEVDMIFDSNTTAFFDPADYSEETFFQDGL